MLKETVAKSLQNICLSFHIHKYRIYNEPPPPPTPPTPFCIQAECIMVVVSVKHGRQINSKERLIGE